MQAGSLSSPRRASSSTVSILTSVSAGFVYSVALIANNYLEFWLIDGSALASCIPTMFALSFFGIIHVPINVPALGAAVKEDNLDVNRELIAHGISNTLSGFVGSIQVRSSWNISFERMTDINTRTTWSTRTASCSLQTVATVALQGLCLPLQQVPSGSPVQP